MSALPLQLLDNFLLQYNMGQVFLAVFILALLGSIVQGSRKVLALNVTLFGILYLLTPASLLAKVHWKFFGLALLVVGPMLLVTARK